MLGTCSCTCIVLADVLKKHGLYRYMYVYFENKIFYFVTYYLLCLNTGWPRQKGDRNHHIFLVISFSLFLGPPCMLVYLNFPSAPCKLLLYMSQISLYSKNKSVYGSYFDSYLNFSPCLCIDFMCVHVYL